MRPCARAPPTDARLPECARKRVQRVLARLSALGLRDGHTAGGAPAWRRRRCARVQPLRMRLRGGLRARRRSCMRGAGRARWEFHSAHPLSEHSARPRARARKCGPNIPPLPPARSLPLTLPPPPTRRLGLAHADTSAQACGQIWRVVRLGDAQCGASGAHRGCCARCPALSWPQCLSAEGAAGERASALPPRRRRPPYSPPLLGAHMSLEPCASQAPVQPRDPRAGILGLPPNTMPYKFSL